jgi:hypothetical protein
MVWFAKTNVTTVSRPLTTVPGHPGGRTNSSVQRALLFFTSISVCSSTRSPPKVHGVIVAAGRRISSIMCNISGGYASATECDNCTMTVDRTTETVSTTTRRKYPHDCDCHISMIRHHRRLLIPFSRGTFDLPQRATPSPVVIAAYNAIVIVVASSSVGDITARRQ